MGKHITKKQIAQVCLKAYESVLEDGKKDNYSYFQKRLIQTHTGCGVCYLYTQLTGDNSIYHSDHFKKYNNCKSTGVLDPYPLHASTKAEAKQYIKTRMDILKSWI